jgi:hypothetical protein
MKKIKYIYQYLGISILWWHWIYCQNISRLDLGVHFILGLGKYLKSINFKYLNAFLLWPITITYLSALRNFYGYENAYSAN